MPWEISAQYFYSFRSARDGRALCIAEQVEIQLISERTGHRDGAARLDGRRAARLVVGTDGDVAAYGADGVAERGAVLDLQPRDGVGVVAAPDLRRIAEHTRVKAAASAAAAFKQDGGERLCQSVKQLVNAEHIAVRQLALTARRKIAAEHIAQMPVHVPFDIGDVVPREKRGDAVIQICADIRAGQVKDQLAAAEGGRAPGPEAPSRDAYGKAQSPC